MEIEQVGGQVISPRSVVQQSPSRACLEALIRRRSAREVETRAKNRSTQRVYESALLDFAAFMLYRSGLESAPATWLRQRGVLVDMRDELLDYLDLNAAVFSSQDVDAYRIALENVPQQGKGRKIGLAPSTINSRLAALQHFFKHAHRMGLCERNPATSEFIDRLRLPDLSMRRGLSLRQVTCLRACLERLDRAAPGNCRDRALILFLVFTGARRDEAVRATWTDIKYNQEAEGVTIVLRRKGDFEQQLLLTKMAADMLRDYRRSIMRRGTTATVHTYPQGYVFPSFTATKGPLNHGLHPESVTTIVKRHTRAALGESYGPHALRHTFATLALEAGAPLHIVQDYLGHREPRTTMRYYHGRLTRNNSAAEYLPF